MICSYIRSSSYNAWDFCQNRYYIEYVLGIRGDGNRAMHKGTIVHKVLECLASIKLQLQNTNHNNWIFEDEILDQPLNIYRDDILEPESLSMEEIDSINKTRINKYNYPPDAQLAYGHTRYGTDLVETLINEAYQYYSTRTNVDWQPVDLKDVTNWTWMALDYKQGLFDPRKLNIIQPELKFDIPIKQDWAKYDFVVDNKHFVGNLAICGTIDLIFRVDDDIIEIVDHKTGQRKNWSTGDRKDYKALNKDLQLILYYYAAKKLFPQYQILTTIFWIRDGGPFTFCFDDDTIAYVEDLLQQRYTEIIKCTQPQMIDPQQNCNKCTRFCDFYKQKKGNKNLCKFIHDSIQEVGIDQVTKLYNKGTFNQYQAPGEVE